METDLLIASFLEITAGDSHATAVRFLQNANWRLEEAIQHFFNADAAGGSSNNHDTIVVPQSTTVQSSSVQPAASRAGDWELDPGLEEEEQQRQRPRQRTDNLSRMFQPPTHIMYQGTFEQAKFTAAVEDRWLIVNYRVESFPIILVIDPITGRRMDSWTGMIGPERLVEVLLEYMDESPRNRLENLCNSRRAIAVEEEGKASPEKVAYPPLPEEATGDRSRLCRIGIRLPDGRNVQRSFLREDRVELLWSLCCLHLEEAQRRPFRFVLAAPGTSKSLEYGSSNLMTFEESGLANCRLSMAS